MVDTPFKTEVLKFNLWDNNLLRNDESGAEFERSDSVKIELGIRRGTVPICTIVL